LEEVGKREIKENLSGHHVVENKDVVDDDDETGTDE